MMRHQPTFSIITCTLNSAKYLPECLDSVKSQTYQSYEHIFVDGGSHDGTLALLKKYEKTSTCPVKVLSIRTPGISHAMNMGIRHASGKYLCHLHSDDLFAESDTLKKVIEIAASHREPAMIVGDCSSFDSKRPIIDTTFPKEKLSQFFLKNLTFSYLLLSNKFPHPSVYIRRDVFTSFGLFDETLKTVMDYEYWLRTTSQIRPFFTDVILSRYRFHQETVSEKNKSLVESELKAVRQKYRLSHPLSSKIANFIYNFSSQYEIDI